MLTVKQEKFCLEYLKDGNASRAYREAYNVTTKNENTIKKEANKLLNNPNIAPTIKLRREQLVNKALWTKEDSINKLKEALEMSEKPNEIVMVIKELNAMHGFNAPTESKIIGELTVAQVVELPKR